VRLIQAQTIEDVGCARELFEEYAAWLGISLCFQNFDKELAALPGEYAPPSGRLLLAFEGKQLAGCVALRKIGEGTCEMKRLFVRLEFRGKGLGRMLTESIVEEARQIGYERMRLDTLPDKMEAGDRDVPLAGFPGDRALLPQSSRRATFMELSLV